MSVLPNRDAELAEGSWKSLGLRPSGHQAPTLASSALTRPNLLERFEGCLKAGLIGDILGLPFETRPSRDVPDFRSISDVFAILTPERLTISDDTQMTICNARWLSSSELPLDIDFLVGEYSRFLNYGKGLGQGTRQALVSLVSNPGNWFQSGVSSSGNGIAMRAAPIGLRFQGDFSAIVEATKASALITHADQAAFVSGILLSTAVSELVSKTHEEFDFGDFLKVLIQASEYHEPRTRPGRPHVGWQVASLSDLLALVPEFTNRTDSEIAEYFGNGAYVMETVPFVLTMFGKYWRTPDECMARIISCGRDADTNAAIAGNLLGALHGSEWLQSIELLKGSEKLNKDVDDLNYLSKLLFEVSQVG